ncbi:zinc-binding dehydrogenase [Agrobacterium sp. DE0009]|uniref:zinc-binding dehydrogenase n=1 Tax=Agrobacterium sp. DE0009 TaxID=2587505 RepID=UPI00352AB155
MPQEAMRQATEEISACAASGAYAPRIAKTYALDELVEAHQFQESGTAVGKIIVRIQNP